MIAIEAVQKVFEVYLESLFYSFLGSMESLFIPKNVDNPDNYLPCHVILLWYCLWNNIVLGAIVVVSLHQTHDMLDKKVHVDLRIL